MSNANISDMYFRSVVVLDQGFAGNTLADYRETKALGDLYKVLGSIHADYYCIEQLSAIDEGCEATGVVRVVYIGEFDDGFLYETLNRALSHTEELKEKYDAAQA